MSDPHFPRWDPRWPLHSCSAFIQRWPENGDSRGQCNLGPEAKVLGPAGLGLNPNSHIG